MNHKLMSSLFAAGISFGLFAAETNLLKNSGFESADAKGKPAEWVTKGTVADGGVSGKALKVTTDVAQGKTYRADIMQNVNSLKPGKYALKGKLKGDFYAVWLVVQSNVPEGKKHAWLDKASLKKNGEWMEFSMPVELPAGTSSGKVYVQPFGSKADNVCFLDEIQLISL